LGSASWVDVGFASGWGSIKFGGGGGISISEFSEFVIGSTSSPLSVSWLNFDGQRISANDVRLKWSTSTESDNLGFEIQRSLDGLSYEKIGFVDGGGNSTTQRNYSFIDNESSKSYYYRLKQIDGDGTESMSRIIYIKSELKEEILLVYPNPTYDILQLATKTEWANNKNLRGEIYDSQGKLLWNNKGNLLDLQISLNNQLKDWKQGVYILKLYTPNKVLQTKFIKQ
jgi:hypothetical protein